MRLLTLPPIFSLAAAVANPVVQTHNGYVRGTVSDYVDGINVFKGIRYANTTAGENRWKSPPHPGTWEGIINATEFSSGCPQRSLSAISSGEDAPVTGDEDCLFLNIWTPEGFTNTSNYPVFFWIYGGRFEGGSGADLTYEGSGLASRGVVVVTFNYRLDALGFLAHPNLTTESEASTSPTTRYNASGNYGLMDQIAALHWTNENIAQFGGNASQITLGGQSAGAGSVLDLVYSPLGAGLFQGAIAESGARAPHDPLTGSLASSHNTQERAEAQGSAYLDSLNLTLTEAREADLELIIGSGVQEDTLFDGTPFADNPAYGESPLFRPVLDGYVLPYTYAETLAGGLQSDVPILTGNNKDESGASNNPTGNLTLYLLNNNAIFDPLGLNETFYTLFPAESDETAANRTNDLYRNQSMVSTWLWANAWAAGGAESSVYTYYWTHAPPDQDNGAFHGSEINYVFANMPWGTTLNNATLNWTSWDYAIADTMSQYWVNFISTGNPNGSNLTKWVASSNTTKMTMQLGNAYGMITIGDDEVIGLVEDYFSQENEY